MKYPLEMNTKERGKSNLTLLYVANESSVTRVSLIFVLPTIPASYSFGARGRKGGDFFYPLISLFPRKNFFPAELVGRLTS